MAVQSLPAGPRLRVQWISDPSKVPSPVNQFILQGGPAIGESSVPDTFVLTLGNLNPPLIPPDFSPEDLAAFAQNNFALTIELGRFVFTPTRLKELHDAIGQALVAFEGAVQ